MISIKMLQDMTGKFSCDHLNMRCFSPRHVGFIALDSVVHGGTGIEGVEGAKFQEVDLRWCFSEV
jgi:hypothetical protein